MCVGKNLLEMGESSLNIVLVVQAKAPGETDIDGIYINQIKIPEKKCANMSLVLLQNRRRCLCSINIPEVKVGKTVALISGCLLHHDQGKGNMAT